MRTVKLEPVDRGFCFAVTHHVDLVGSVSIFVLQVASLKIQAKCLEKIEKVMSLKCFELFVKVVCLVNRRCYFIDLLYEILH